MAKKKPSEKEMYDLVAGELFPEDGRDPRYDVKSAPADRVNRKTLQLCRQVREVVAEVLSGSPDEVLRDLDVYAVEPAAGVGRLLVKLTPSVSAASRDEAEVMARVTQAAGLIRGEVAAAITRRKMPELVFVVSR